MCGLSPQSAEVPKDVLGPNDRDDRALNANLICVRRPADLNVPEGCGAVDCYFGPLAPHAIDKGCKGHGQCACETLCAALRKECKTIQHER